MRLFVNIYDERLCFVFNLVENQTIIFALINSIILENIKEESEVMDVDVGDVID